MCRICSHNQLFIFVRLIITSFFVSLIITLKTLVFFWSDTGQTLLLGYVHEA